MTFLELVQTAWKDCGQSGDGPASVTGVTGHQLRFVNWVRDSWLEIQDDCDEWVFMKASATFATIAAQETYGKSAVGLATLRAPLAAFRLVDGTYVDMGLFVSTGSDDEVYRVNKVSGVPQVCYFDNGNFSFDTIPDAAYTIKMYYRRNAQELLLNGDVPICDSAYHRAIRWGAVKSYARWDKDDALFVEAREKQDKALASMYSDLTPSVTFGGSAF